ncbi:mitotic fidelity of chromosome transmission- protein [Coemansia spiralis]|nr:mitotic fidelity of chromosome transmission- protein [Coemansia spiralis]
MSSQAVRRAKSPATRNKFNDIGVTGRKTGVRVAGKVRVDEDGLENVDEFYKQTTPQDKDKDARQAKQPTRTLHTLLSPTPIRSTPNYESLVGALDMSDEADGPVIEDEVFTPPRGRTQHALMDPSPAAQAQARAASRRTTMAPSRAVPLDEEWVRSPKRGRRVTMAFASQRHGPAGGEDAAEAATKADEHMDEDPGELTSATVIEGDDTRDDDNASAADDDGDDGPVNVFAAGGADEADDDEGDEGAESSEAGDEAEPRLDPLEEEEDADDQRADLDEQGPDVDDEVGATDDDDDGEEVVEERPPSAKKQRAPAANRGPREAQQTEQEPRRSARASVQPLAYWRNEHIEYEYARGEGSGVPIPKMKSIVRVRHTSEEKNHAKKRRVKHGVRLPSLRGIKVGELDLNDRNRFYYYDDENYGFPVDGDKSCKFGPKPAVPAKSGVRSNKRTIEQFDDNDDIDVDKGAQLVREADGVSEHTQEVAISRGGIEWSEAGMKSDEYKLGLGLVSEGMDGTPKANSGVLCLPVGGKKPLRRSSNWTTFYLVTSGKVEVRLHMSTFRVGALGQFFVPQHNTYAITNVGTHPAQIYYVQIVSGPSARFAPTPTAADDDDDDDESEGVSDSE